MMPRKVFDTVVDWLGINGNYRLSTWRNEGRLLGCSVMMMLDLMMVMMRKGRCPSWGLDPLRLTGEGSVSGLGYVMRMNVVTSAC